MTGLYHTYMKQHKTPKQIAQKLQEKNNKLETERGDIVTKFNNVPIYRNILNAVRKDPDNAETIIKRYYQNIKPQTTTVYAASYKRHIRYENEDVLPKVTYDVKRTLVSLWRENKPLTTSNLKAKLSYSNKTLSEAIHVLIKNKEIKPTKSGFEISLSR